MFYLLIGVGYTYYVYVLLWFGMALGYYISNRGAVLWWIPQQAKFLWECSCGGKCDKMSAREPFCSTKGHKWAKSSNLEYKKYGGDGQVCNRMIVYCRVRKENPDLSMRRQKDVVWYLQYRNFFSAWGEKKICGSKYSLLDSQVMENNLFKSTAVPLLLMQSDEGVDRTLSEY